MAAIPKTADIPASTEARVTAERSGVRLDKKSRDYFQRREVVESDAARNAASDAARRVHQELADEYAALLGRS
jgi:hypothetical protein